MEEELEQGEELQEEVTEEAPIEEEESEELSDDEREELERLRKKEFNFKKIREKTKQEKEEVKKSKEEIGREWTEFQQTLIKERQEDALTLLVGDDDELRKKALYNFKRIDPDTPVTTKEDIYKRMKEAVNMAGINQSPNQLTRGSGHSGYRGSNKAESDDSKALRKEFGISDDVAKKYKGDWTPKF